MQLLSTEFWRQFNIYFTNLWLILLHKTTIIWSVWSRSDQRRGCVTTIFNCDWYYFSMTIVRREKQLDLLKTSHQSPAGSAVLFRARGDHGRTLNALRYVRNLPPNACSSLVWQPNCMVAYLAHLCRFHQCHFLTDLFLNILKPSGNFTYRQV
jgi:hypothetical protein